MLQIPGAKIAEERPVWRQFGLTSRLQLCQILCFYLGNTFNKTIRQEGLSVIAPGQEKCFLLINESVGYNC